MTFPTLNSREEAAKISSSMVSELRTKFLEAVAKAPELYYDKDVEKLKTNDWSLQRFLNHSKSNVDKAVECLDEAMKWRKSFGVHELNDKDFPREAYQSAPVILYGKDLNGSPLLIIRSKVNRKIKSWVPTAQKYFVHLVEKADSLDTGKGLSQLLPYHSHVSYNFRAICL